MTAHNVAAHSEERGLYYLHAIACANTRCLSGTCIKIETLLPSAGGRMYGNTYEHMGGESNWKTEQKGGVAFLHSPIYLFFFCLWRQTRHSWPHVNTRSHKNTPPTKTAGHMDFALVSLPIVPPVLLSPSCLFPQSNISVWEDLIEAGAHCNICPCLKKKKRRVPNLLFAFFWCSLSDRTVEVNVRHQRSLRFILQVSAWKSTEEWENQRLWLRFFIQRHLLLPLSPQSGAHVGNSPLRFKKQFNPNQRSSRCLFVSKMHWG